MKLISAVIVAWTMMLGVLGEVYASPVNSHSAQEIMWGLDGQVARRIEYYIQTDKAEYALGETVQVIHRIANTGIEPRVFQFNSTPGIDLVISRADTSIWSWSLSPGQVVFPAPYAQTLAPGEVWERQYTWDMTDLGGTPVEPGVYMVSGVMHGGTWIGVPITIVPEPSLLLVTGVPALLLLRIRRR